MQPASTSDLKSSWPLKLLASLMLLILFDGAKGYQASQAEDSPANSSSSSSSHSNNGQPNPYWRRPGCFKVGHTRTISIPGCVKFNLSTNACRGFCMSYSIPANDDLGPLADTDFEHQRTRLVGDQVQQQLDGDGRAQIERRDRQPKSGGLLALGALEGDLRASWAQQRRPKAPQTYSAQSTQRPPSEPVVSSQYEAAMAAANDKHDVISVSQCCNMMETEDVFVNLRCGANEIRKLVFKTAKTCECFFCKHV